jgi:UDP-N-acetylmuramoyl-L-alanyl-D-glutamate--2,6-diaminopimelate ligase
VKLAEILKDVSGVTARGAAENLDVASVCCDSRKVRPRDVFVAVRGTRDEGLRYVEQALARGAAAVVAETPPPPELASRWVRVADARLALAQMACAACGHPSRELAVFAVTGTNGKTTTAGLLRDLLRAAGRRPGLISTVYYEYGDRSIAASRTTPDACELQELLAAMRHAGCDCAVMEASSHAVDQRRIGGLRFAATAFTNLTRDHLDYHHDFETYFRAKRGLFEQQAADTPGGPAIVNRDDAYGRRLIAELPALGLRVRSFGFDPSADIRAERVALAAEGSRFDLVAPEGRASVASGLPGRYNVANMLAAAGLGLAAGVPLDAVAASLAAARPRWGRLERVETPLPATVYVDYAHTDDALRNVLAALREVTAGRLIAVFGCGGDRDRTKRPLMGRAAAELADHVVVTSDNPRSEDPLAIIREIVAGLPADASWEAVPDRRLAIRAALRASRAGDVVVIAGKGHENYQEFANRVVPFDDREQVRSLAHELA